MDKHSSEETAIYELVKALDTLSQRVRDLEIYCFGKRTITNKGGTVVKTLYDTDWDVVSSKETE